jgi:(p)ppGpp synthase/HD superfamily hydrolase
MDDKPAYLLLSSRFTQAIDYARILHIETRKATNIPYMAHLLGVASLVMGENGHAPIPVTEDMAIAAILHDTVEDHGGLPRLRDIEHNFGAEVERLIEGLTDSFADDPNEKAPWEERKRAYVERLEGEPLDVQLISAADKLYNARTILSDYREIGDRVFDRFKRGGDKQLGYFKELLRVFRQHPTNRIVDEFERVVEELDARMRASKP